ncbi:MAG: rod-binding protein [Pseudomonadota bacterium]
MISPITSHLPPSKIAAEISPGIAPEINPGIGPGTGPGITSGISPQIGLAARDGAASPTALTRGADGRLGSSSSTADLRAAAEGFEALFLNQVLKSARAVSFGEGLGDSSGLEMTQSMLDMHLSDMGAGRAGLGIAEAVYRQFAGRGPGS